MVGLFRFILGLAFGSFLNVIALRYDPERFLFSERVLGLRPRGSSDPKGGRSACSHCGKTLRWFELIPLISFIAQLGRCRRCRARLSFQYPIAELLAGLIVFAVPYGFGAFFPVMYAVPVTLSILWTVVLLVLLLISLIDLRLKLIPDEANVLLAALGIVIAFITPASFGLTQGSFIGHFAALFGFRSGGIVVNRLVAMAAAGLLFGGLIVLTRGRGMGVGDLKLAIAFGILFGWPDVLLSVALAFIIGSLVGLGILAFHRGTMKSPVPFGPFLALGAALVFFFGYQIVHWYFSLFSL